jgi:hypothetical protein
VLAEWQIGDPVSQFLRDAAGQEEFQVVGQAAEADILLGGEENAGEVAALLLPGRGDSQEVLILREQNAAQLDSPGEELLIVHGGSSIILAGQDTPPPPPQGLGHGHRDMHVHVQGRRHLSPNTVEIGASHSFLLPWVYSGPK